MRGTDRQKHVRQGHCAVKLGFAERSGIHKTHNRRLSHTERQAYSRNRSCTDIEVEQDAELVNYDIFFIMRDFANRDLQLKAAIDYLNNK